MLGFGLRRFKWKGCQDRANISSFQLELLSTFSEEIISDFFQKTLNSLVLKGPWESFRPILLHQEDWVTCLRSESLPHAETGPVYLLCQVPVVLKICQVLKERCWRLKERTEGGYGSVSAGIPACLNVGRKCVNSNSSRASTYCKQYQSNSRKSLALSSNFRWFKRIDEGNLYNQEQIKFQHLGIAEHSYNPTVWNPMQEDYKFKVKPELLGFLFPFTPSLLSSSLPFCCPAKCSSNPNRRKCGY